jgi:hypothetical protein
LTTENTTPENEVKTNAPAASVLIPETPAVPAVPVTLVADTSQDEVFAYDPTGDVGLDMALDFAGKAGIGSTHPAMVAAQGGDFGILKATLAAKGVAGWEQFVALGEAAYARTSKDQAEKAAKDQAAVYELAGSKEDWQAVQKWAGENATPEEKAEINALLNKGGIAAKGAVNYLLQAYAKAGNVVKEPAEALGNASRGGIPTTETGPLSPRAYSDAVNKLNNKLGGRMDGTPEYTALQARRAAFRPAR